MNNRQKDNYRQKIAQKDWLVDREKEREREKLQKSSEYESKT